MRLAVAAPRRVTPSRGTARGPYSRLGRGTLPAVAVGIGRWVLIAMVPGLSGCRGEPVVARTATVVQVRTVERPALAENSSHYTGRIEPASLVPVAFKGGGYVERILEVMDDRGRPRFVQVGDAVTRGTTLAWVRDGEYQARVGQVDARVEGSRSQEDTAKARLDEIETGARHAQTQLAEAEAGRQVALGQVTQARAAEAQARSQVEAAEAALAQAASGRLEAEAALAGARALLGEAQAGKRQALAAVEEAQAAQTQAQQDFDRASRLLERRSLTRAELDTARNRLDGVKARVAAARGQVAIGEAREVAARAQVDACRAKVETARAQGNAARASLEQARLAVEAGAGAVQAAEAGERVGQARIERARAALVTSEAQIEQARAQVRASAADARGVQGQLREAKLALGDTLLTAPISGVVVQRPLEPGALVGPGTLGFVLADVRKVKAVYAVPDTDLPRFPVGCVLAVTTAALPGRTLPARVVSVSPAADPRSRGFEIEAAIDNRQALLKPGMLVTISVHSAASAARYPVIPMGALIRSPQPAQGYAVFVVAPEDGRLLARLRKVKLGEVAENGIQVTAGLLPGERVVVTGTTLISDGETVRIVD